MSLEIARTNCEKKLSLPRCQMRRRTLSRGRARNKHNSHQIRETVPLTAENSAAPQCGCARKRDERVCASLGWRFDELCKLISVRLQILEKTFEFALHRIHLL